MCLGTGRGRTRTAIMIRMSVESVRICRQIVIVDSGRKKKFWKFGNSGNPGYRAGWLQLPPGVLRFPASDAPENADGKFLWAGLGKWQRLECNLRDATSGACMWRMTLQLSRSKEMAP